MRRGVWLVSTMFYILYNGDHEVYVSEPGGQEWRNQEADSVSDSWIRLYNSASFWNTSVVGRRKTTSWEETGV